MNENVVAIVDRLKKVCEERYTAWQVRDLEVFKTGTEVVVCKAHSSTFGPIAIKVPWQRWVANNSDGSFDGRGLLLQEQMLAARIASSKKCLCHRCHPGICQEQGGL